MKKLPRIMENLYVTIVELSDEQWTRCEKKFFMTLYDQLFIFAYFGYLLTIFQLV